MKEERVNVIKEQLKYINFVDFSYFRVEPRGERIVIEFKESAESVYYLDDLIDDLMKIKNTFERLMNGLAEKEVKEDAPSSTLVVGGSGNEILEQGEVIERQPQMSDNPLPSETKLGKLKPTSKEPCRSCHSYNQQKRNCMMGLELKQDGNPCSEYSRYKNY